jgi:hypothetical protein
VQIELTTIPMYLYAMYSTKDGRLPGELKGETAMQGKRWTEFSRTRALIRRALTPGRAIPVLAILAAIVLFLIVFPKNVNSPTIQVEVDMGSMGRHIVNIWMDPNPPRVGEVTVTAQVVDQGGNPAMTSAVNFQLGRRESGTMMAESGEPMEATDRTKFGRFQTLLDFPDAGEWWMDVGVLVRGQMAKIRIPFQVAD